MHALRQYLPEVDLDEAELPPSLVDRLVVNGADFGSALREVDPSALREIDVRVPEVSWERVVGFEEVKQQPRESTVWPLESPEKFDRSGIDSLSGVLLYGPPDGQDTLDEVV